MMSFAYAVCQKSVAHASLRNSLGKSGCRSFAKFAADAEIETMKQPSFYGRLSSHLKLSQQQRKVIFAASLRMSPGASGRRSFAQFAADAGTTTLKQPSFHGRLSSHLSDDGAQIRKKLQKVDDASDAEPQDGRHSLFHERLSSYLSPSQLQHELRYVSRMQVFKYVSQMQAQESATQSGRDADRQ
jgi:hypothetical protein